MKPMEVSESILMKYVDVSGSISLKYLGSISEVSQWSMWKYFYEACGCIWKYLDEASGSKSMKQVEVTCSSLESISWMHLCRKLDRSLLRIFERSNCKRHISSKCKISLWSNFEGLYGCVVYNNLNILNIINKHKWIQSNPKHRKFVYYVMKIHGNL
jgi:hypothetical protein